MLTRQRINAICSKFIGESKLLNYNKLNNGLSNDNYLLNCTDKQYLLKCYKEHWPYVALSAQQQLSESHICSAPIWFDEINKWAVFDYITGHETTKHTVSNELLEKLVSLHLYPVKTQVLDIAQALSAYDKSAVYQQYKSQLKQALYKVSVMPTDIAFCHNDLVKENIIDNENGTYFIDFEYAQSNDVYFDLAALSVSFNLNNEAQEQLLTRYFKSIENRFYCSIEKLKYFQLFYLILSIAWYEERGITDKAAELHAQLNKIGAL
ncbi:phosphotransferase [Pseudoalteromonas sp. MMG010]|uniref:phosphotransferase n=1 Tax=Pseudoalteromonas sp. MMG010 TaxID=2822685 RepID=UPI001B39E747|nr:phosphotransferase [Pseudoalteromonas sp. MMG010]MBQ4832134.1 phosphotransferase [Pseudoalteromonas sp. MMG010]